jgi:hypothetical protein
MRVTDGGKVPWKGRKYAREKYPLAMPLTKEQLKLLKKLAMVAPTNAHKLSIKTKKAYSFVYKSLIEFERRKIASGKVVKSKKGTKEKICDLELEGIFWILKEVVFGRKNDRECKELIIRMVKHYSSKLPLVFGKWSHFRDAGLEDLYLLRLWFLVSTHLNNPFYKGTGYYYWLEMEHQMNRYFYLFDFHRYGNHFITDFDPKLWLVTLRKDREIRDFVVQELKEELKLLKNQEENVECVLSFLLKDS